MASSRLSRSFAGFFSSPSSKEWRLLYSASTLHSFPFLTDRAVRAYGRGPISQANIAEDLPAELPTPANRPQLPRPAEIPFQAKVANQVHLVGTIDTGVKLQKLSEVSYASVSMLVNQNPVKLGESRFLMPLIFRGDLADLAACYLKKNDVIYVSGQLTGENLPFTQSDARENIKLIAYSLNYVSTQNRGGSMLPDKEYTSNSGYMKTSDDSSRSLWDDLLNDPTKWVDHREEKLKGQLNKRFPDFKHKELDKALWLKDAPYSLLPKIEGIVFGNRDDTWNSFVENPSEWWDNRANKPKPTYPDFKHKVNGTVLWLNSAPAWVLPLLPPQSPTEQ